MKYSRIVSILSILIVTPALSQFPHTAKTPPTASGVAKTEVTFAQRIIQGFSMRVWLSNQMVMGSQAWDTDPNRTPDGYGLEYPAGSGLEHLYGAAPWIGGIIDGVRHVTEGYNGDDARKEFVPEYSHLPREHFWHTSVGNTDYDPLGYSGYYYNHGIVVNRRGCDNDGDGKINEDDLDGHDNDGDWNPATDDIGSDGLPDSTEVSCDGQKYDPIMNPDPAGDNWDPNQFDKCHPNPDGSFPLKSYRDFYTEKNGLPDHGEPHVDEDYGAISDNDLICSATDTFAYPTIPGHFPMGIKVVQRSYAWDNALGDAILPFEYSFVNVGTHLIRDVYIAFFADMDVGPRSVPNYYTHNYAAYIDSLHLGYIHNPQDRGSTPLGVMILHTPRRLDSLKYVFQWWDFTERSGPGVLDSSVYEMMANGFDGQLRQPDQPITDLSDTRFLLSFGPFGDLRPGDTLNIGIGLVSGSGVFEGANAMVGNAEKLFILSRRKYYPQVVPPSPPLSIDQQDTKAIIRWSRSTGFADPVQTWDNWNQYVPVNFSDSSWRRSSPPCGQSPTPCVTINCATTGGAPPEGGRIFGGYRLYRYESLFPAAPQSRSFSLVRDFPAPDGPGSRLGSLDSTFVDSPLVRGHWYWYAVTSYSVPDVAILPMIASGGGLRYDTMYTPGVESSIDDNKTGINLQFAASDRAGQVLVVPNPYRGDQEYTTESGGFEGPGSSWSDDKRLIKFIHLPRICTIRIFTVAGDVITTLQYESPASDPNAGELSWHLQSESGRPLASGVYVFSVESDFGKQIGKFVIAR